MKFKKFKLNLVNNDIINYHNLFNSEQSDNNTIVLNTPLNENEIISNTIKTALKHDINFTVFDKQSYKEYINIDNENRIVYNNIYISDNYIPIDILYNTTSLSELYNNNDYNYFNSVCWWCCHELDKNSIPVPLPIKYIDCIKNNGHYIPAKKFKCKGIFCSFNCALSYSEIYHKKDNCGYLLNYLYKKCCNKKGYIKKAPPKEILQKFGGMYSIEEYRQNFLNLNIIDILEYPIEFISRKIYEKQYEFHESKLSKYDKNIELVIENNNKLQQNYKQDFKENVIQKNKKSIKNNKNDISTTSKNKSILNLLNIKVTNN